MSKRLMRVLSLIMVLCMFLSVGTPAFAVGTIDGKIGDNEIGTGEIDHIGAMPDKGDLTPVVQFQAEDKELGYSVVVEAPLGALPADAELRVEPIKISDVRSAVTEAVAEPDIRMALDVSFWQNDERIDPAEPVQVILTADSLVGREGLKAIQIREDEEPAVVEPVPEEELTYALEENEVVFMAEASAVYVFAYAGQTAMDTNTGDPILPPDGWDHDIDPGTVRPIGGDIEVPMVKYEVTDPELGYTVTVEALESALPVGTELRVEPVEIEDVREAVAEAVSGEPNILLALDISFWLDVEVEPTEPVQVVISAPELDGKENLKLVHIPDEADPETVDLLPSEELGFELGANAIAFEASDFSVYAVVDEGEIDPESRIEINFYNLHKQETPLTTVYVKNSDELLPDGQEPEDGVTYINTIVGDPGLGEDLDDGFVFVGWSLDVTRASGIKDDAHVFVGANFTTETPGISIGELRQLLADLTIAEGDVLNVYAMIFRVFTVTYLDEQNISMGTDEIRVRYDVTSSPYTISKDYVPTDPQKDFEGWLTDDDEHISDAKYQGTAVNQPYKMGTTMTIDGSITFTVSAPTGHWLAFDENGKGATYNAPQFVKDQAVTHEPTLEMLRLGYVFKGWYTVRYEDNATVDNTKKFVFGQQLTDNIVVYAKWDTVSTAQYTVIYWKENIAGSVYDFAGSQTITGTVGSTISVTHNNGTIRVTGADNFSVPTGFEYNSTKTDSNKTVAPQGNTVINVYCDRKSYTLTFVVPNSSYITYVYGGTQYSDATMSTSKVTNSSTINTLESSTRKKAITGFEVSYTGNNNNRTYYIKKGSDWYQITDEGYYVYNASAILRLPSSGNTTVKTITAKYEQYIGDQFPIVGTDGYAYDHGERWSPGTNNLGWDQVMTYVDAMREQDVIFTLNVAERPLKTMNYYVEALPTDSNPVTAPTLYKGESNTVVTVPAGMKFVLYSSTDARYTGVTLEDLVELDGYTFLGIDTRGTANNGADRVFAYIWDGNSDGTVNIYYTRNKFSINYFDGIYVDGNGNKLTDYSALGSLNTVTDVTYGSDTTSYNKGGANYYEPVNTSYPGFVFEGWYIDDACTNAYTFTTMPKGDITVYAKWRQIQYRVFMHPQATLPDGTNDNTLSWGDELQDDEHKQAMNFRVSYMGGISMPTGIRSQYEFIGWFTADGEPFNMDSRMTENIVKTDYDKTDSDNYTDKMNKFGEIEGQGWNSDLTGWDHDNNPSTTGIDRYWITKKLDLYGKWSAILNGALGIGIIYDANGGTDAPHDPLQYKDNIDALACAASTAPDGMAFQYWVVQKWDADQNKYVDTDTVVYPGAAFTVHKALAKETDLAEEQYVYETDENGDPVLDEHGQPILIICKAYTMQLRAEYITAELAEPTHITWHANNNTGDTMLSDTVAINETIQIPVPQGEIDRAESKYIPWTNPDDPEEDLVWEDHIFLGWARLDETASLEETIPLGEEDLFLKYDYETKKFYALVDEEEEEETEETPYYLVGSINGNNYEGTDYAFHNGKLIVSFTEDSYVAVMPEGAAQGNTDDWFMTDGLLDEEVTSATLKHPYQMADQTKAGKLFVPGNTLVTFTLTEVDENTLTLSYTKGTASAVNAAIAIYTADEGEGEGESEPTWKAVNYVAADEFSPYQTLYAVWAKVFYIYHTSDNTVEKVIIPESSVNPGTGTETEATRTPYTVDLASRTKEGYLYGGLYTAYAGATGGTSFEASSLNFGEPVADTYEITNETGSLQPRADEKFFYSTKDKTGTPYEQCTQMTFTAATMCSLKGADGNAATGLDFVPEAGKTYFIKEVSAAAYLLPYLQFTYKLPGENTQATIGQKWLISAVDDYLYRETGFVIVDSNNKAQMVKTLKIVQPENPASPIVLTPDLFSGNGLKYGYLTYLEYNALKDGDTVMQYWITPDNVLVIGDWARSYKNIDIYVEGTTGVKQASQGHISFTAVS